MNKYTKDENYYYDIIRKNIRKYRLKKGFTQNKLSEIINYSNDYIRDIENLKKKQSFSILVLGRIADVLEIDIKYFFDK